MSPRLAHFVGALGAALLVTGCPSDETGTTSASGGSGGTGSTSTTGTGGQAPCMPDDTQACYDGPSETAHIGVCADGTRTCGPSGAFGACEGQVLPVLKDDCTQLGDEDCDGISCSEHAWSVAYDTDGESTAHAIAFGPGGTVVIGGTFSGILWFDVDGYIVTNPHMFLVQVLPNGTSGWSDLELAGTEASAFDLAVGSDGGMVYAGGFRGSLNLGGGLTSQGEEDVFVARRDPAGVELWGKSFGDSAPSQRATHVAIDPNGDVIVVGRFTGDLDFGGGATLSHPGLDVDVFVAKLNGATGVGIWAMSYGDPALDDAGPVLAVGAAGEVVLAGGFQGAIAPAGLAMALSSPADVDVYVAKLDAQGGPVWAKSFAGSGDQSASSVALDPTGAVFIAGAMRGSMDLGGMLVVPDSTADAFVAKLSSTGAAIASRRFDDTGDTSVAAAGVDAQGSITLTGSTTGSVDFGGGVLSDPEGDTAPYVAKLDGSLVHRWSRAFTVEGAFTPAALAVDRAGVGTVAVAGGLAGTVHFGPTPVTSEPTATIAVSAAAFQP